MKKILEKLKESEFFVAITTTGFTAVLQLLSGVIINKIIALKIGPSGIAMLGQFANFRDMMTRFGTGSIGQGVTKYVADSDYKDEEVITTASLFTLIVSLFIGLIILICSKFLSVFLFKTSEYQFVFYIFALTLTFFSLNNLLISIINGKRKFVFLARIKIANSIISLTISSLLSWFYLLEGALIAMAINTSIVFIVSLVMYFRNGDLFIKVSKYYWSLLILKKLLGFTLMTLTGVLLKPLIELFLRNYIIENASVLEAGLWESMKRISLYYTQIITVALGAYYLPKLSSLTENSAIRQEIFKGIKLVMPLFVILALFLYFTKGFVISFLFTEEFIAIKPLFLPQLIGDFFMLLSFMVAYLLIAKAMTKLFIITQVTMAAIRIILSVVFFNTWALEGILWANAMVYLINTFWVYFLFRKILFNR